MKGIHFTPWGIGYILSFLALPCQWHVPLQHADCHFFAIMWLTFKYVAMPALLLWGGLFKDTVRPISTAHLQTGPGKRFLFLVLTTQHCVRKEAEWIRQSWLIRFDCFYNLFHLPYSNHFLCKLIVTSFVVCFNNKISLMPHNIENKSGLQWRQWLTGLPKKVQVSTLKGRYLNKFFVF